MTGEICSLLSSYTVGDFLLLYTIMIVLTVKMEKHSVSKIDRGALNITRYVVWQRMD